jgi:hypothetical protein
VNKPLLDCTIANVNSSHISVTASWSPPIKAQSAAVAFYHVALYDSKGLTQSKMFVAASNSCQDATYYTYTDILSKSSQDDKFQYNASIIAENKCGQRSKEFTTVCKSSSSISSYHISIITVTRYYIIICAQFYINFT